MTDLINIHRMSFEDREIILVGTAHVSKESAETVDAIIEAEMPDTVCLELCATRYRSLLENRQWRGKALLRTIGSKDSPLLLSSAVLVYFQRRVGARLGVMPGDEMRHAISTAERVGASIELIDRDVRTTLRRAWTLMNVRMRIKLLFELFQSVGEIDEIGEKEIENMKKKDVLEGLLAELGDSFPPLKQVLIEERDLYLTAKIRKAAGRKIVAVVGAAHIPGILKNWDKPIDIDSLDIVPV